MDSNLSSVVVSTSAQPWIEKVSFSWYDYGLFLIMLGASSLIGIYFGCFGSKQSTTGEYLLGGKAMKVIPVVISLVASHVSGVTLLGVPADVYRNGAAYWVLVLCLIFVAFCTSHIYIPVFFNLNITSTYEYLELRFDKKCRKMASLQFGLALVFFLPIVIYIPALAFSAATGINVHFITPVICGVCIFYTTIGGLKAVVWTDTLQFTITLGAVITVFFLGSSAAGGFGAVWKQALEGGRLDGLTDFGLNPLKRDSFWIVLFGSFFHWMCISAGNQGSVQKFLSVSSLKEAKIVVWLYALGIAILKTLSVLTGLIMYAKYSDCDPFTTGEVKRNDQLLPYYVMDVAAKIPGLPGLFIAGVVSAALSTLSAHLNCLAGTIYEDFISNFMPKGTTEKTASNILKAIVVITGVICTALVYIVERMGGIFPLAIAFQSITSGPALGLFTLGILFPRVHAKGALWGTLTAQLIMLLLILTTQYYKFLGYFHEEPKILSVDGCNPPFNTTISSITSRASYVDHAEPFALFRLSAYLYTMVGTLLTLFFGYFISRFTENNSSPAVSPELVSSVVHFLLPKETISKLAEYNTVETALRITASEDEKEKENEANL